MKTDKIQEMIRLSVNALDKAYAPYSKFKVACTLAASNEVFTGVNIENASYDLTLCAESAAISQMISAGLNKIDAVVIVSSAKKICSPCGACRQRLYEFGALDCQVYLCDHTQVLKTIALKDLLPFAFEFNPHLGQNND